MRIPFALCLLTLGPVTLSAQRVPSVTLSGGMTTAWGGSGPTGSLRLEVPGTELLRNVRVLWGGAGWLLAVSGAVEVLGSARRSPPSRMFHP